MYDQFEVGGQIVHLYNIFLLIAIIAAALLIERQLDRLKLGENKTTYLRVLTPIAILLGLLGAATLEIITQQKALTITNYTSGFTFYGGLLTVFVVLIAYSFISKISFVFLLNFLSAPVVLAHAIGRIGCFFAGCCFGKQTDLPWAIRFPIDSLAFQKYGDCTVHPTQLYESGFLFLLFFFLVKLRFNHRFSVYLIGYGVFRFLVEFIRADSRGELLGINNFSPSQLISILLLVVGVVIYLIRKKKVAAPGSA
ncbi:MAG: prolipoprotein diacylglyceryl transferase [Bacteroidetes bacterium]|nr:prolipoprotein diacylglyceryl transferase [Bacteroidota bacterium]